MLTLRQLLHLHRVVFHPFPIGMRSCQFMLDHVVFDDLATRGVDEEHLAGLKTSLAHNVLLTHLGQHAAFRGKHHITVIGDLPTARTEAVAVKQRPHKLAVGEDDVGWAIPWFNERVVVFVECTDVRIELLVVLPRRGHHHQDGMWQGTTCKVQ